MAGDTSPPQRHHYTAPGRGPGSDPRIHFDGSVSLKCTPIKPSLQQISQQDFGGDKALVISRAQPWTHFTEEKHPKGKRKRENLEGSER